jgi:hypothetical protein
MMHELTSSRTIPDISARVKAGRKQLDYRAGPNETLLVEYPIKRRAQVNSTLQDMHPV